MKKMIVILVSLALICASSLAEGIDWASMTDEELHAAIEAAQAELNGRYNIGSNDLTAEIVVFNQDGRTLTLSNGREGNYMNYDLCLEFDAVYENNGESNDELVLNECYVNGWDIGALGDFDSRPGHRKMDTIVIGLDDTDVKSLDEIETIEFVFGYLDEDYSFESFAPVIIYSK
jgi:hypothetical protein